MLAFSAILERTSQPAKALDLHQGRRPHLHRSTVPSRISSYSFDRPIPVSRTVIDTRTVSGLNESGMVSGHGSAGRLARGIGASRGTSAGRTNGPRTAARRGRIIGRSNSWSVRVRREAGQNIERTNGRRNPATIRVGSIATGRPSVNERGGQLAEGATDRPPAPAR